MEGKSYDLIIIGAGPAGLTASIYVSRFGIDHLVIGSLFEGRMAEAHMVCNFSSEKEIKGPELVKKMEESAKALGAKIELDKVTNVTKNDKTFSIKTMLGKTFFAKTLLVALGAERKKLNAAGEKEFFGKGVSYCATCDGKFFTNKIVAVVGGSSATATTADYLADLAGKVYLIHGEDKLKADKNWQEKISKNPKIEMILGNKIKELKGKNSLNALVLEKNHQEKQELKVNGVFVEMGIVPNLGIIDELGVEKDANGFIEVKKDSSTNIKGMWAAGDITNGSDNFRQIITACSEGAIAAKSIHAYLKFH